MAELFEVVTAHCFFHARCRHTETGIDPLVVHAAMERHYAVDHRADLDKMLAPIVIRRLFEVAS